MVFTRTLREGEMGTYNGGVSVVFQFGKTKILGIDNVGLHRIEIVLNSTDLKTVKMTAP